VRLLIGTILAATLALAPASAPFAVSYNSSADHGTNTSTSWTKSYTAPTLTDGMLVICIVGDVIGGNDDITGVTYNGVAATLIRKNTAGSANNRFLYMYAIAGPTSGAHNWVITNTNSHFRSATIGAYEGMSSTFPPDSSAANQNTTNTTLTSSTTVVSASSWLVMCGSQSYTGSGLTAGTGTTKRVQEAGFLTNALFDSNGTVSTGSQSLQYTTGAATDNVAIVASFAPAGGAPVSPLSAMINAMIRGGVDR